MAWSSQMRASLDGLIATQASFEVIAEKAMHLGYRLVAKTQKPPLVGSFLLSPEGEIQRIRFRFFDWVICINSTARHLSYRWKANQELGALILEPDRPYLGFSLHWVALALITLSRCLLVLLSSVLTSLAHQSILPLWIVMALILGAVTYTSITLIHRAQWNDLNDALDIMAPDWIPRLSRQVGSLPLTVATVVAIVAVDQIFNLQSEIWILVIAFILLDLMPTRRFRQAKALVLNPKIMMQRSPRRMMQRLEILFDTRPAGVYVLDTVAPETLLRASEQLVREGAPISVLGPDIEFLEGTLRSNFAWDDSESADFHFENLMTLVGFDHWRQRFGNLDYRIGESNAGLSSSEAAILQVARAMAQSAETLILVDALAPLSSDRQRELLQRLNCSKCRFFVYSSVSDLWEVDAYDID